MGYQKEQMILREERQDFASTILEKAGAVSVCDVHGYPISNDDDDAVKRAYAIGTNMIKKGECDEDRVELMDAIKAAYDNAYCECPGCAKWERE